MPYLGTKGLKASDIRRFNVTGSTSATHTLTWVAPTEQSLIVTINGVKQQEDAYSVSGTTLTLTVLFPIVLIIFSGTFPCDNPVKVFD